MTRREDSQLRGSYEWVMTYPEVKHRVCTTRGGASEYASPKTPANGTLTNKPNVNVREQDRSCGLPFVYGPSPVFRLRGKSALRENCSAFRECGGIDSNSR
ncbi:hypothetical protein PM082_021242 [Marasmius tenuissimus]|nr:hypothetical protein PM082_021242 [Marasmius tenuissimus]